MEIVCNSLYLAVTVILRGEILDLRCNIYSTSRAVLWGELDRKTISTCKRLQFADLQTGCKRRRKRRQQPIMTSLRVIWQIHSMRKAKTDIWELGSWEFTCLRAETKYYLKHPIKENYVEFCGIWGLVFTLFASITSPFAQHVEKQAAWETSESFIKSMRGPCWCPQIEHKYKIRLYVQIMAETKRSRLSIFFFFFSKKSQNTTKKDTNVLFTKAYLTPLDWNEMTTTQHDSSCL